MKFKIFLFLCVAFFHSNTSTAYDWGIPVTLEGLDKLNWKTSSDEAKTLYPGLVCSSSPKKAVSYCQFADMKGTLLTFYYGQLFRIKLAYPANKSTNTGDNFQSIFNFKDGVSFESTNIVLPKGKLFRVTTQNTDIDALSINGQIEIELARAYHPFINGELTPNRSHGNYKERSDEAASQSSLPKEPRLVYKPASKFDPSKRSLYSLPLSYNSEYNEGLSYFVGFEVIKYGDEYYISAYSKASTYSLTIIIDGGEVINLKSYPVDGSMSTFKLGRKLLERMASAKDIDYKYGYRIFVYEKYKESWFGEPDYTEGVFGEQRIKWIAKFLKMTDDGNFRTDVSESQQPLQKPGKTKKLSRKK